ncbi:bifunctional nuclease family protein [Candidatus Acetothermia bacterium]|nr:bifunctional nuclease family protein [Candidatus Acetothermia bacterium]MBI3459729.1 bifunctional nuclease family protein [Candidatus Acetothermia bacterium]MBI3659669.1 bifunctional nuclease family protein [Candidatus Acetothermia bacterium]
MREVEVKALLIDPIQNSPVLLLKDQQTEKVVPVWIGQPEATAIAMQLQHKEFPRPLTHDLLRTVLKIMNGELDMVVIDSIQDSTYYATLFVRDKEGQVHEIDARPSDSIAMALRTGSPIYVSDEVFEASAIDLPDGEEGQSPVERKKFQSFVEDQMHISDFKRFIQ